MSGRGPRSRRCDPTPLVKRAERPELSGHGLSTVGPGYRRIYGETTKLVSEASVLKCIASIQRDSVGVRCASWVGWFHQPGDTDLSVSRWDARRFSRTA